MTGRGVGRRNQAEEQRLCRRSDRGNARWLTAQRGGGEGGWVREPLSSPGLAARRRRQVARGLSLLVSGGTRPNQACALSR